MCEERLIRKAAVALRELWMTQMGLDEDEIRKALQDVPLDLEEEWGEVVAMKAIKKRNERDEL